MLIGGQDSEWHRLVRRLLELTRTRHPDAVAVQQQPHQQTGIEPGTPATGAIVGSENLGKVQRLHNLQG